MINKTTLVVALVLTGLVASFGCQAEEQGESRSSETAAHDRAPEGAGQQTRGGDLEEAQGELGPEVAKI